MRGTNDCIKNILKKLKGKRGISIIALVVTIIVLLILLSISINVMMGDEGTFEHTKNAVTEQELAQLRHDALVAYVNIATVKGKRNVTVREIVDRLQRQNYTIREHINVNGRITGVSLSQSPIVMEKGESTTTSILIERENNKYYGVIRDNNYEIFINEKGEVDVSNTPETIIDDPQETPQDTITTNVKNTDIATASLTGEEIQVTGGNTEGTTELTLTVNGIDYRVAKIAVVSTDKVNYEVLHRKEEFDGTFTTEETELLLASVNETVTPETKTYEGFNSPEVQTVIVRDDRNTRIIYQYTRKSFELTLTKGNGVQSVSGAGTYKYEEPVTIGYTLEPGYDTARITGDVTERNFTMPAKNVQANIEGVEKEILITFVAGNGVNVDPSTKTVTFNGTYGELPSPNKTGYDFEGWYTGENGTGNKIQAEDKVSVTTNIELYAKWTAKEYQIALNAGNGANAGTTTIYELYEGKYSLTSNGEAMTSNANPITKPERNGYAFGGYYTSANGEGTKVIDENGYLVSNVSTSIFAENGTLYANWIQAAYQEYNGDVFVKYYYTLAEALSGVTSGNTITALVGTEETTAPTLAQDKTVTLNLNGKTITLKNTSLANNGALTITGAGTLTTSTANNLITNTGTLELAQSGTISNTNSGEYFTVRNTGTINVSGTGTVSSATEITNSDPSKAATIFGGNINVSNGTVLSTGSTPIVTSGTFNMTGGKVRTEKRYAVYIYGSGTATVSAGTIEKDKSAGNEWTSGACFQINNTATATLSGGTIKNYEGNGSNVIYNYSTGDIVVDGATIQNLGTSPAGTVAGTGKIIVESGVVTTTGADAIRIENAQSKVIIGKEGDTSTTSPEILGRIYGTAEGSQITVNSGKVMGTTHGGINTLGSVTVNGGEISIDKSKSTVSEPYTIAAWSNTSKIKITGGTISNSMAHTVVTGADVTGEIEITGGTITSTTHPAVQGNKANITISGSPVITGETRGVSTVTGTITITGGTISATNGVGVVVSTGTVTIGTNEQTPNVSTETPNITGSIYGVQVENGGTFNFYDGVIRGATNKAMLRAPIGKPEGYEVYKTNANGIETAILARTVTISLNNQDATTAGTNEIYEVYGIAYLLTNNGEVMSTEANPITKPEKENYLFDGYYTQTNGQGTKIIDENGYLVSGVSTTQFNSNSTIYAKWKDIIYAEYNGNNLVNTYNTLSEAFTGVTSGNTIKAINGNEETVAPTLASGKTVTLDLNGKTITLTNVTLTNNGNLTITGNGTLTTSTANDLITNAGTLNLAQTGTVSNTSTERISVVRSTGTTNITGTGNIESKTDTYAIYGGNINISNGTITTEDGGVYTKNTFNMTDGKIHSSTCAVLISNGTATISGGIIEKDKDSEGNWQVGACFNVSGNSNVTLSGGTIQGFDGNPSNSIMHDGTGSVIIDGATVLNSNNAITNGGSGKIIVKSGTVTSTRANGIRNSGASTGNIEIKGGTISSGGSATLRNEGTGTIIIGEENSDSIESPIINGRVFGNGENIGDIIVHSGKILGTSAEGIASSGNIIINGGLISTLENGTNGVILNSSTGKITITGGTIQSKDYMAVVVKNTETGEVEITGGTITSTQSEAIYNAKGKTTISGNPTITGKNGIDIRTGEGIITGGTISGTNGYGVSATTGTVTIGTNESPVSVSTEVPSITGTTYGVQVTEGTLNFYDGVIKGAANQAISGTVVAKPEGYEVYKTTENNIETAVLSRVNTITFNSNDGTFENSETTNVVKFVGTNVIEGTYKVPTKENYSFINWNTQANGTGTSYTLQDLNTLTQDITLYAQFKQVTLVTGPNFNKTIKELNSHETEDTTIKSIIFKKTSDLTGAEQTAIANTANDKIFNVDLDNEGLIKTYKTGDSTNGYTVYVVSDYDIYANASSEHMFRGIQVATSITFDNFNTSNVTNMSYMFYNCKGLTSLNVNNFDTTSVINMSYMFGACAALTSLDVSNFETSNVNSMFGMFDKCKILTSININTNKFNTSNVTTMGYMFNYCQKLTNLDVSEFDTSKVKNMSFMFNGCNELTSIEVRNFDTSNVIYMENMFCGDYKLANLDVSKFITSNVTNMSKMFFECYALTSLDVSEFDTSKVTNMQCMFYSCRSLTSLDVSHFNTSNVENMGCMFYNCNSLTTLDVSSFNTSNVTNMYRMFAVNDTLTTIYASNNFNTDKYLKSTNVDGNEVNNTNMFDISTRLVGGSGTVFDANHIDKTYAHIDGGVSNPGYFHNAPVTITFNSNDGTFENNETTNVIKMSGTNVIQGTYKVPTKAGYEFLSWNTQADGTGTSYTSENLNTITEATTLYAQWTKIYSISYNLDGGTVSTANPTSYTKESNTITLNNPTKNGYKFTGWTETIKDFTWNEGFINLTTGAIETSTTYPDSHYTDFIRLKAGVTYTLSGQGDYGTTNLRWRIYNLDGTYRNGGDNGGSYTLASDGYLRLLYFASSTEEQRNNSTLTVEPNETVTIPQGSTGNREYTANWLEAKTTFNFYYNGGALPSEYQEVEYIESTKAGAQYFDTEVPGNNNNLGFEIQYSLGSIPTTWSTIFGSYTNEATNATRLLLNGGADRTYYNINSKAGGGSYSVAINKTINTIYTESIKPSSETTFTFTSNAYSGEQTPVKRINGNEQNNTIKLFSSAQDLKVYYFKIYDGDTLIRYYVPCIHEENNTIVAGMYDKVTGEFKKSARATGFLYAEPHAEVTQEFSYGETKKLTKNSFERQGFTFTGWNTKSDGTGTRYEDEETYTNSTLDEVTINLYAQWQDTTNPSLTLSKETYQEGFNDWELTGGAYIDNEGVLILPNSNSEALSRFYQADEFWHPAFDVYTENPVTEWTPKGGWYFDARYYNNEFTATENSAGLTSAGFGMPVDLNTWYDATDGVIWNLNQRDVTFYGDNIKYVRLNFRNTSNFSVFPSKIRNFKIYGQQWQAFYNINLTAIDNETGIKVKKYALGNHDTSYFSTNGTEFTGSTIRVTESGVYTVYVEDNGGNKTVQTIEITRIDKTAPTNTKPEYTQILDGLTITNKQVDNESGLQKVQYAIKKSGENYGEWQDNNTFTSLKHNTTYFIKTRSLNKAGVSTESAEEELFTDWITAQATFLPGEEMNIKMKTLAGDTNPNHETDNTTIKGVRRSNTIDNQYKTTEHIVSTNDSESPIYMWFDDTDDTIYWYTEDTKPSINPNATRMFKKLKGITSLDASDFDTSNVTTMMSMFNECSSLTSLDVSHFDTSKVTDMKYMFLKCSALTSLDVSHFDTSKVTTMAAMFQQCNALTSLNVSLFDTPKVTDMSYMFYYCNLLTSLDVSHFNTSNVTNFAGMFEECNLVTSLDVSHFDTIKATDISFMFLGCSALTSLNVSHFETTNVVAMNGMFASCSSLTSLDVSHFDTSNAVNMNGMFGSCTALTSLDVSHFNTTKVTDMSYMFYKCTALTSLDVSHFNTSNVENMGAMFTNCSTLTNIDVSNFNTSNVTNMYMMFANNSALTTIYASNNFNTDKYLKSTERAGVEYNHTQMFNNSTALVGGNGTVYDANHIDKAYAHIDGGTSNPGYFHAKPVTITFDSNTGIFDNSETTNVVKMSGINAVEGTYKVPTKANYSFINWNTAANGTGTSYKLEDFYTITEPTTLYAQYKQVTLLAGSDFNKTIKEVNNADTEDTLIKSIIFKKTSDLTVAEQTAIAGTANDKIFNVDVDNEGLIKAYKAGDTTNGYTVYVVSDYDIHANENCYGTFLKLKEVTNIDLSNFNTSNTTNMQSMFLNCEKLTSLNLGDNFNTSNVTNMQSMFESCIVLPEIDVSGFDTENVTNMKWMFTHCRAVEELDVSHFETQNVTSMRGMFINCYEVTELDVSHFNTINVTDMNRMFSGCINVETLNVSQFNTAKVTDMEQMFYACKKITSLDVSHFNTGLVTNMKGMFAHCELLTSLNVTGFTTANVTNMQIMFYNCKALQGLDVSHFDTSKVTDMKSMFEECNSLTTLNVSGLNTSAVTTMRWMFYGCSSLTSLNVSDLDTENVTDMRGMFNNCNGLTSLDVTNFNTSKVTDMQRMFGLCNGLTSLDLSNFDTRNVTDMHEMFFTCTNLTTIYASGNFVVDKFLKAIDNNGNEVDSRDMFNYSTSLVGGNGTVYDANHIDKAYAHIDGGTSNPGYFHAKPVTITFDANTGTFDNSETTNVAKMSGINAVEGTYKVPTKTGYGFISWNTAANGTGTSYKLEDFYTITEPTTLYAQYKQVTLVSGEDFNKTIKEANNYETDDIAIKNIIFKKTENLTASERTLIAETPTNKTFNVDTDNEGLIKAYKVETNTNEYTVYVVSDYDIYANTNCFAMFYRILGATSISFNNFNTINVTSMRSMFNRCSALTSLDLSNFNTSNVKFMQNMFSRCSALTNLNISNFNTSNVTNMNSMFFTCSNLTAINVSNFNTLNVTDMKTMFYDCNKLQTLDVSNFNTSNVTDMYAMFFDCSSLTTLNVNGFDTEKVTNMRAMFANCSKILSLNVSSFNTANVTTMRSMFNYCNSLTSLDVSGFNTTKVESMKYMFYKCGGLTTLDVSGFNTANATDMYKMFSDCTSLTTIYASDNFVTTKFLKTYEEDDVNEIDSRDMFNNSTALVGGNGTVYDANHIDKGYAHIDGGSTNPGYFHAKPVTITFDSNTGTFENNETTNVAKMSGINAVEGTYKVPTKANYSFINWNTAANGTGTSYKLEDFYTITEPTTLYAQYKQITLLAGSDFNKTIKEVNNADTEDTLIKSIIFKKTADLTVAEQTAIAGTANDKIFNVDVDNEGLIKAYKAGDTTNGYTVYVVSDYDIYANGYSAYMFKALKSATNIIFNNFDTSNVIYMNSMFYKCNSLNSLDVTEFNTENVINMDGMFASCSELSALDVTNFDTSKVENMNSMFNNCSKLTTVDVRGFDTQRVTTMRAMFFLCTNLTTLNVSRFHTDNVVSMRSMFEGCKKLSTLDVSNFNTTRVTEFYHMFYNCRQLTTINVSGFDTNNATDMAGMFALCNLLTELQLSNFNTNKVTDMSEMFWGCTHITTLNLSSFNTSNVTNMNKMFAECSRLTTLNISSFNTSNVTDMSNMFSGCFELPNLNISNFNTGNVTNMKMIFSSCEKITNLIFGENLNTSKVTNMYGMFSCCYKLENLDLSGFDTSNVTNMGYMFNGCYELQSLDLSSFNTSNVTNMYKMLAYCKKLTTIYVSNLFVTENFINGTDENGYVVNNTIMFEGSTVLVGGNGTVFDANHIEKDYAHIDGGTSNPGYFHAKPVTITFDANTGTFDNSETTNVAKMSGINAVEGTYVEPTKANYSFVNWNTAANGTGTGYTIQDFYTLTSATTLYAMWDAVEYTITLNNGGADTAGTPAIYEKYGVQFSTTSGGNAMSTSANGITIPAKAHQVFKGYYTGENGTGNKIIDENGFLVQGASLTEFSSNGTLYANWEIAEYTITLNNQGANTTGTANIFETYGVKFSKTSHGEPMTTSSNAIILPEKTDYAFKGYFTGENGTGNKIIDENGFLVQGASTTEFGANGTLYAKWELSEFEITLNNQSATSSGTTTIYETYGVKYSLDRGGNAITTSANGITIPTRTGYAFGGYYTGKNGAGTQVIDANGFLSQNASATEFSANGTLYAKWTDATNPTLTLNKETYQEDNFSDWNLTGGAAVDSNGTLNLPTSSAIAESRYYSTGNEKWYLVYDVYTTNPSDHDTPKGGTFYNSYNFDSGFNPTQSEGGTLGNGWAKSINLNEWNNVNFIDQTELSPKYGNNIQYVNVEFRQYNGYASFPQKIKNLKVYGQLWQGFYYINVNAEDNESGVKLIKYAQGNQDASYFASNGTEVTGNTIRVTENGVYTVYVEDNTGNKTVQTIEITQIDKTAPLDTKPTYTKTANSITVTNAQVDPESGVVKVEYAIKEDGGEYGDWQTGNVFTGLRSSTTYTIKTRTTNAAMLTAESAEETVTTDTIIYTISLDEQGATTSGTSTIYEIYEHKYSLTNSFNGAAMTTVANPITIPEKTGSLFAGYYTGTNGAGTQVIDANGYLTSAASTTLFDSNNTIYANWSSGSYIVTFDACGGTVDEGTRLVPYNTAVGSLPTPEYVNHIFNGWYTAASGGTKISASTPVGANIRYYAQWTDAVAEINGRYFVSLSAAVGSVTTSDETTVRLLKDTSEKILINSGRKFIFDFGNNTLRNNGDNTDVIENKGELTFISGHIFTNSPQGAINNRSTGILKVTGGSIETTSTKQAIYNEKGRVEISGTAYLKNGASAQRATVQNVSPGKLFITGGTIISEKNEAVKFEGGECVIGTQGDGIDTTTPILQGFTYGLSFSNGNLTASVYDGTIKGKNAAFQYEGKINKEPGCGFDHTTERIGSYDYDVARLAAMYEITFNPCGGTLYSDEKRYVREGETIGTLPDEKDVRKSGYKLIGWFTSEQGGTQVTENEIMGNDNITYYAHWLKVMIAESEGTDYNTITEAISKVPAGVETTITLHCDANENITIPSGKNVILDLNGYYLSSELKGRIIKNSGTLTITGGDMNSDLAEYSAIDNDPGCTLVLDGVRIIAVGTTTSTQNRQAVYNKGGYVTIRGNSYLESMASGTTDSLPRGTVHNFQGGTVTIEDGTIINKLNNAITNGANSTVILGTQGGVSNTVAPTVQGAANGIYNVGTINFYDGTIKGVTAVVGGSNAQIAVTEADHDRETGTEEIEVDGVSATYNTLCLLKPITITLSTQEMTSAPITATITYSSNVVSGRKAGFGSNLDEAIANASESTADSVTITGNGYVYAEGVNSSDEPVTENIQITNIL